MESKDGSHHWSRLERLWVEQDTSEADVPSTVATRRKLSARYRRWQRTNRHCEAFGFSPWSHRRLIFLSRIVSASITGLNADAASPGELNRTDKKMCRYLRALSNGKAHGHAATESHGRSWTNAQLLHKWKVFPARAEIAIRRGECWQAVTEQNHAHLQTMVATW